MNELGISRRQLIALGGAWAGATLLPKRGLALPNTIGPGLSPWSPGQLDIHHINTGRGNSTFVVMPDGTSLLIDCGASNTTFDESAPLRPNASKTPGAWVAEYIRHHAPNVATAGLDYMVATHIHPDHIGDIPPGKASGSGGYIATGLSEVDELIPARVVIDRAFPNFGEDTPPAAPFTQNYLAWLNSRLSSGRAVEAVSVGSRHQIIQRTNQAGSHLSIRSVAGNGRVWTGRGQSSRSVRSRHAPPGARLNENSLSIALVFRLGRFGYFAGGDLSNDTFDGRQPWADVETPAARAAGRVEVAMADHHGYFDAVGRASDQALDPQAYIIPSWHITHPGQLQMQRMLRAWPGENKTRDVFALDLLSQNRQMNARFDRLLRSTQGHVVVRVQPNGSSYEIIVLDSSREGYAELGRYGPYISRK